MPKSQVEVDARLVEQMAAQSKDEESIEEYIIRSTGILPESSEFLSGLPEELREPVHEIISLIVEQYGLPHEIHADHERFEFIVNPDSGPLLRLRTEGQTVEVFFRPIQERIQKFGEITVADGKVESTLANESSLRYAGHAKLVKSLQTHLNNNLVG